MLRKIQTPVFVRKNFDYACIYQDCFSFKRNRIISGTSRGGYELYDNMTGVIQIGVKAQEFMTSIYYVNMYRLIHCDCHRT